MNEKYIFSMFYGVLIIVYGVLGWVFSAPFAHVLSKNLPFRESYFPTPIGIFVVYGLPIILGYIFGGILRTTNHKNEYIYYVNVSLLFGIVHFSPFIFATSYLDQSWSTGLSLSYDFMLFPVLFLIGCAPYYVHSLITSSYHVQENKLRKYGSKGIFTPLFIGIFIYLLNILPGFLSRYLVGADIYYHAAMANKVSEYFSLSPNPLFLNEQNYYYSIGYYIIAFFARGLHVGIDTVIFFLLPLFSSVFFITFYVFVRRITFSSTIAIVAILFILPFNQMLWYDPSMRIFSYTFFVLFLYFFSTALSQRRKLPIILSIIFLILTAASHPEIAIHSLGIVFVFGILVFIPQILLVAKYLLIRVPNRLVFQHSIDIPGIHAFSSLMVLLTLYFVVFWEKLSYVTTFYPITKVLIFNEIPFSLLQPIGVISFIVFLFVPAGLVIVVSKPSKGNIFLLSISSLFVTVIFYFTYIWALYHRYFAETAYFGLSIIASIYVVSYMKQYSRKYTFYFCMILFSYVLLSVYPKYKFIESYSTGVAARLASYDKDLQFLKAKTENDTAILINPDDMLNRYVPFYTNRYIIAGSNEISKEHQWQVLSICNGPFYESCTKRVNYVDYFFQNPTTGFSVLKQNYKVDYLYISKFDREENPQLQYFLDNHEDIHTIGETELYTLYDVRNAK